MHFSPIIKPDPPPTRPDPFSAGVWLLARCADLQGLRYDVRNFGWCLLALFGLGVAFRVAAILCMLLLNRDRQR